MSIQVAPRAGTTGCPHPRHNSATLGLGFDRVILKTLSFQDPTARMRQLDEGERRPSESARGPKP
jgi:hypothetical protein